MYLFSALRSFISFYSSMTAPVGTIPLPFCVFKEPQNAYEEFWNEEMPHVYTIHCASPTGVRNVILQKRWRLVCAVQKAVGKGNDTLLSVQQQVVSSLQESTIVRPVKVVQYMDHAFAIVPPLRATRATRSPPLIHSIEGQAVLTSLNLTLMADALSTTSDISHCDTDSWSAESTDSASQLSSRTSSTEGSRD